VKAYLLDTNALLCLALDRRALKPKTKEILFDATLCASVVSGAEIAIKSALGKLPLPPPFETDFEAAFRLLLEKSAVDLLALDLTTVARLLHLPLHHRDPFDRLIMAQALQAGLTVATRDAIFTAYAGLEILSV
jgi:PIN domain nuclease of toxin-antitoxin system